MVPAHGRFMSQRTNLDVSVRALTAEEASRGMGLAVRVSTEDPAGVARLRGLGFFGFLTSGNHHRPHHLAMASGSGHP